MSKYGFNENEVVRTVLDMVDKDGFHKETVIKGSVVPVVPTPPPLAAGFVSKEDDDLAGAERVTILVINIPENNTMYFDYSGSDTDFAHDIGDTLDTAHSATEDSRIAGLDAALGHGFTSDQMTDNMYFYVYAVDAEDKVTARTKLTVALGS